MRYLLILASIFGSLLIDPAARAQKKVPGQFQDTTFTSTEAPDNKYGEGGTRETMLDEMNRVRTKVWRNKDGKIREVYQFVPDYPKEDNWQEMWSFRVADGKEKTLSYSGKEKFYVGDFSVGLDRSQHRPDTGREEALSLIEKVEKQFAKNGTVPTDTDILREMEKKPKEVDTKVEPPELSKNQGVFDPAAKEAARVKAEEEERQRYRSELLKNQCDGIREKIRTLQDSLRKRQEEPASTKRDLERETIRKQIDVLLSRLVDCPKEEPIDAQFDCLKSKFPEIRLMVGKKDRAWDPTSKRDFDWDTEKQAWVDGDTKESICPPSGIDPCLVGTWKCIDFKEPNNREFTGGGTGFRVTFKSDGTETVDYSSMQPTKLGPDATLTFTGTASAKISTDKGVAKTEGAQNVYLGVSMHFRSPKLGMNWNPKYPGLGPGGLGSPENKNNYKCTEDSLEYQTSYQKGQYTCTLKLTKVKP